MTYAPNVPSLSVTEELQVQDIRTVMLAEFTPGAGVREVMLDPASAEAAEEISPDEIAEPTEADVLAGEAFPTRPVAAAAGLRLHRVIAPDHKIVTQFDAALDKTPLDFLGETGAVVAVAQPGDVYSWKLIQLGSVSGDGNVAPIMAIREATPEEGTALDEMYPGWLSACRAFDAAGNDYRATKAPNMPPPALLQRERSSCPSAAVA